MVSREVEMKFLVRATPQNGRFVRSVAQVLRSNMIDAAAALLVFTIDGRNKQHDTEDVIRVSQ